MATVQSVSRAEPSMLGSRTVGTSLRRAKSVGSSKSSRRLVWRCTASPEKKLKVIVAGGGIAGLSTALACQKQGLDVVCFEKKTEYKAWGGPIQLAGNALAALEIIDPELAAQVIDNGVVTGDRVNGLLDGETGDWFVRFDTRKPSLNNALPLTIVIGRYLLVDMLRERLNEECLVPGAEVVGYENKADGGVIARLADGSTIEGDVLVGADGIRSKVREQMKGEGDEPCFSGYTCYTSVAQYTPPDVDTVGYQVFLGPDQYFVSSDIGNGQQWYAFRAQEPGMVDDVADRKPRLEELFKDWCPEVRNRIASTEASTIERRDIYDRAPTLLWQDSNAILVGDAAHAMQPNMGQGGCQAIEDAQVLAEELIKCQTADRQKNVALTIFQLRRVGRAAAVTGFARTAALANSTYRRVLGQAPYAFWSKVPGAVPFWSAVEKLQLPHPGRIAGQFFMLLSIDVILQIITAGGARRPSVEKLLKMQDMRDVPDEEFEMKGVPGFAK